MKNYAKVHSMSLILSSVKFNDIFKTPVMWHSIAISSRSEKM